MTSSTVKPAHRERLPVILEPPRLVSSSSHHVAHLSLHHPGGSEDKPRPEVELVGRQGDGTETGNVRPILESRSADDVFGGQSEWLWKYDEHGKQIWYRRSGEDDNESVPEGRRKTVRFATPPIPFLPTSTVRPHGYWMVDDRGTYLWYRFVETDGQYVRDTDVDKMYHENISPDHKPGPHEKLTWTGVGRWYWTADEEGRRTWFQLSRIGDEVFEIIDRTDSWQDVLESSNGNGNAPHVYLSSGPGGRGGYWAIDDHGRYVWYHYIGPDHFEKDESTAIDVDQARQSHYRQMNESVPLTDELRRRPGRERVFIRRRQRPTGGRRRRPWTKAPSATTRRWVGRSGRRRGYWIRDENGRLSWHTYPPFRQPEMEIRPTTTPLLVWPPITRAIRPEKEKNVETDSTSQSVSSTFVSTTASSSTSTTLPTWWGRTPAWKTVRGYWTRDRWSGKMVWHTYTTTESPPPTLFPPTATYGFNTDTVFSVSGRRSSVHTTSSKAIPATSGNVPRITKSELVMTSTQSGRENQGAMWRSDEQGRWVSYPSLKVTQVTKDPTTSPSWFSSTTSTPVPSTTESPKSVANELPSSVREYNSSHVTSPISIRDSNTTNRTNRTITSVLPPNNLISPSTSVPLHQVSSETLSSTEGVEATVAVVTTTARWRRPTTVNKHDGYWLVNENGKRLIYVRPNATGHHADTWRQFIGAATPTHSPGRRWRPGYGERDRGKVTRRPPRIRHQQPRGREELTASIGRKRHNRTRQACIPRRPVDLLFSVDVRSPRATHVTHLWQAAFSVVSSIRMDTGLVRVTFVPEAPAGHRPTSGSAGLPSLMWPGRRAEPSVAANRRTSKPVADVVKELVESLRRHRKESRERSAEATGPRRSRRRRTVGVFITDGRSPDTAGTVYDIGRAMRRLPKRVEMLAVGIGPEVSGAQLMAVTRGRLDRILTVFTGSSSTRSPSNIRQLSARLSRLVCRRR